MYNKAHLKNFDKGRATVGAYNSIRYDKEKGVYVSTDGHIMMIEKTADNYPESCNFEMMSGLVTDVNYPEWGKVVPDIQTMEKMDLAGARLLIKKPDKKVFVKQVIKIKSKDIDGQEDFIWFNADLLQRAADFIGSGASLYYTDRVSPIIAVSEDGQRSAVVMPMRENGEDYQEQGDWCWDGKKQKPLKKIFIVKSDGGYIRVFDNRTKAEACGFGSVIEDYLY